MKHSRGLPFHTRRDAWVEVDLGAIEHNIGQVRQFVPENLQLMAVLKADAYGHGALMVLPTLEASGVTIIGVASMDEALQLREAGATLPILVLSVTPDWVMHAALEYNIQITVFTHAHLRALEKLYQVTGQPTTVQIKVDTGMNRIGVNWEDASAFIAYAQQLPWVHVEGIYSHFSTTDDPIILEKQIARWQHVLKSLNTLPALVHIANSAATWQDLWDKIPQNNVVRLGISLFGYAGDSTPLPQTLKPAMGLKARVVHTHALYPGEGVSYGQTYQNTTTDIQHIATLPLGYADGVPRNLSNKMGVLYQGQWLRQVGTITMDQMMVDITGIPDIQVGDILTLIGHAQDASLTLSDWSRHLNTIEYELMCGLRVRLPKTYVR